MASASQAYEDEYDTADVEPLLTERLEGSDVAVVQSPTSTADSEADGIGGEVHEDDASVGGEEDRTVSPSQGCWHTARSSAATLLEEASQRKQKAGDGPIRKRKLAKEQQQIQMLTRQVQQYKKRNAELHHQVQAFFKNEAIAQLENKSKEKQHQIDQLLHENRMLSHQQRLLHKQIEELQESKDNFPLEKCELQEELRVCKDRLRQYKEKQKEGDEKSFKMHQQTVDLAAKNKALSEKIRKLEHAVSASSSSSTSCLPPSFAGSSAQDVEAIIASQEDEISRLQQRVALMKKTHRSESSKHERQLKASRDEVEQTRAQLDTFYQQLFAKEKAVRSLFLQMKILKRAVQDLVNAQQTNHHMQQLIFGREARFSHRSPHHRSQQQQQHHWSNSSSHLHQPPPQNYPLGLPKRAAADRIHDTLKQLGYVPTFNASGNHGHVKSGAGENRTGGGDDGIGENEDDTTEDEGELPSNCVQGKLVPCPPPSSADRKALRGGTGSSRTQIYWTSSSSKNSDVDGDGEVARSMEYASGEPLHDDCDAFGVSALNCDDDEGGVQERSSRVDDGIVFFGSDDDKEKSEREEEAKASGESEEEVC